MTRKRRTVKQLPMLPRSYCVEGEDPGIGLPIRTLPDGTAHCLPEVPGRVAPEYMRHVHANYDECELDDFEGDVGSGRPARDHWGPLQFNHEPKRGMGGANRDDRRGGLLCMGHHDDHTANRLSRAALTHIRAKQAEKLCRYLDAIGGEP